MLIVIDVFDHDGTKSTIDCVTSFIGIEAQCQINRGFTNPISTPAIDTVQIHLNGSAIIDKTYLMLQTIAHWLKGSNRCSSTN